MKSGFLILAIFLLSVSGVFCQQNILSKYAELSLITAGPGDNLYTRFGHTAIRIKDTVNQIDLVFNYGTYDFKAPNFYFNFARGRLFYRLTYNNFRKMKVSYINDNQSIYEQQLDLSLQDKQLLFFTLLKNLKPENASYSYDPFYNNCATKPRDLFKDILGNKLNFNYEITEKPKTIRQLYMDKVGANNWGSFGITLVLGSIIDKKANPYEKMFIPEQLKKVIGKSTLDTSDDTKPFVKKSRTIFTASENKPSIVARVFSPFIVFTIFASIGLFVTYKDYQAGKRSRFLDVIIFLTTGIVGLILLLLWFATDHHGTKYNFNILWALAPNLILIYFFEKGNSKWKKAYIALLILLIIITIALWIVKIQLFPIALIPVLTLLLIRYLYLYDFLR